MFRSLLSLLACAVLLARGESPVDTGSIFHVADFHLDLNYSQYGDASKWCHYLRGDKSTDVGKFGNYDCDASVALLRSAVAAMRDVSPSPDAIFWTGDSMPHVPDTHYDTQAVIETLRVITDELKKAFPKTRVLATLGNHDYWPSDQLPDKVNPIYTAINRLWATWLNGSSSTLENYGYYATRLSAERTLLALNTNLYYIKDAVKFTNPEDPAGQFAWMERQLKRARRSGYRVHIISHICPGALERTPKITWIKKEFNERLLNIFRDYADVIDWMLFGHLHTDTFRILKTADGTKTLFLAPAVAPWRSTLPGAGPNNPGFRKIEFDRKTWRMLDLKTYYLDLPKANDEGRATWQLEYSHKELYGGVSDEVMAAAVERMDKDDTLFQRYFTLNSVSYDKYECKGECKETQLCTLEFMHFDEYYDCLARAKSFSLTPKLSLFVAVLSTVLGLYY